MNEFDNTQAAPEGWAIFDCDGSSCGPWQLQKDDNPDEGAKPLVDDEAAWRLVWDRASAGSEYHRTALAYLLENNLLEYCCIARLCAPAGSELKAQASRIWKKACELGTHPGSDKWPVGDLRSMVRP